jgi:uncharacterized protein (DUF2235 family)
MPKNLAIFLDGTWNESGDNTNVWRLKVMLAGTDPQGASQLAYYDPGVGTGRWDRFRGGIGGAGLSLNVREAYQWLIENYDPGDRIFLFGFSRGAYTARSLAGLIARCGLLYPGVPYTGAELYVRYQMGKNSRPIYQLTYLQGRGEPLTKEEERLLTHSRRVKIQMIGVWDTVGALGIPWTWAPFVGKGKFYFHNTNLSSLFQHACHAVSIDEHRGPYKATLWTKFLPTIPDTKPPAHSPEPEPVVEQRWFVGAHSNVGGGYANDDLAQIPLAWMQAKAIASGLSFRNTIKLSGQEVLCDPRDSYGEFLRGFWKVIKLGQRHHRPIDAAPRPVKGGTSTPVNQVIDKSVFQRWREVAAYRPKNLTDWAARRKLDPAALTIDHNV